MTTDKSGRTSAGILLWRRRNGRLEVLLAHMGGPQWVDKDPGALDDPQRRPATLARLGRMRAGRIGRRRRSV